MAMMSFVSILVVASCLGLTHGNQCSWPGQDQDIVSRIAQTCPGLFDASDQEYCCPDANGKFQCCTFSKYFLLYIVIAAVAIVAVTALCCIISCCCCPCCCLYRKRHGMPV